MPADAASLPGPAYPPPGGRLGAVARRAGDEIAALLAGGLCAMVLFGFFAPALLAPPRRPTEQSMASFVARQRLSPDQARVLRAALADANESWAAGLAYFATLDDGERPGAERMCLQARAPSPDELDELRTLIATTTALRLTPSLGATRADLAVTRSVALGGPALAAR